MGHCFHVERAGVSLLVLGALARCVHGKESAVLVEQRNIRRFPFARAYEIAGKTWSSAKKSRTIKNVVKTDVSRVYESSSLNRS